MPIFQTTSYVFEDVESAAAYFDLQEYGNTYSRIMNPTVAVLEERIASLEGGAGRRRVRKRAGGAGGGLLHAAAAGRPRRRLACAVRRLDDAVEAPVPKLSVELDLVDPSDLDAWRRAARAETKALFGETIGNPAGTVLDLEAVSAIAHGIGALIVDNTFATPYLYRPLEFGADIVVHSATKFLGGHGTSIGGLVVDSGRFDWSNGHFPGVAEPSPAYHGLAFHETFGKYGFLMKLRAETLRDLGAALSPFNAFLFLQGVETLSLRMRPTRRERARGRRVPRDPARGRRGAAPAREPLAARYLPRGAGAVFSFDLAGGREAGARLIGALSLWSHLANVGDARSLVIQPATHDAPPALGRRAGGRGHRPGHDPPLGRPRGSRGPALGSRGRARGGGQMSEPAAGYQDPRGSPRSCGARARSRSSASRRTSCGRATSSASTCSGTATG